MIALDECLRPKWLFGQTVHEGCDRGGNYEQAQFAEQFGAPTCIVKLGCWGRSCSVTSEREGGWEESAVAPMLVVFALGARCRAFQINLCPS